MYLEKNNIIVGQKTSIFLSLIALVIIIVAASNVVSAKGNLINELSNIDSFHPPEGDPRSMLYNEWQYFNIIDEQQNISFITTMTLKGNISDPTISAAVVLMSYHTPVKDGLTVDAYPVTNAKWSNNSPDITISGSSVKLTQQGYSLHIESNDASTVFDALFKPETEHAPVYYGAFDPGRILYWRVGSPRMKATGTLTVNKGTPSEKTYLLKNTNGYHDHNWGYWLWQDDVGWDWGQASQKKIKEKDSGKYTFVFGNVTNNNHTISRTNALVLWEDKKIIAEFRNNDIQIRRSMMITNPLYPDFPYPMVTLLNAVSGINTMNIKFNLEQVMPIPMPLENGVGFRMIWELIGTYEVNGKINGRIVSYETKGYLEYIA
jgi:hypothetical protein